MAVKKRNRTAPEKPVTKKAGNAAKAASDFIKSASNISLPAVSRKAPRNYKSITLKFNEHEYRQFTELTQKYDGGSLEYLREILEKEYKSHKRKS